MENEVTNDLTKTEPQAMTPAGVYDLMREAITGGDPESRVAVLERLVALAERQEDRQARREFDVAMSNFKADCPPIPKSKQAGRAGRDGTGMTWMYAPIEQIQRIIDPLLTRHGLSYTFSEDGDDENSKRVCVTVRHVSGHSERSYGTIRKGSANPKLAPGQKDTGTLTTACRKVLAMALGLMTDEDERPRDEISDVQLAELDTLFSQLPADIGGQALGKMGVDRLGDLPADKYGRAKNLLTEIVGRLAK